MALFEDDEHGQQDGETTSHRTRTFRVFSVMPDFLDQTEHRKTLRVFRILQKQYLFSRTQISESDDTHFSSETLKHLELHKTIDKVGNFWQRVFVLFSKKLTICEQSTHYPFFPASPSSKLKLVLCRGRRSHSYNVFSPQSAFTEGGPPGNFPTNTYSLNSWDGVFPKLVTQLIALQTSKVLKACFSLQTFMMNRQYVRVGHPIVTLKFLFLSKLYNFLIPQQQDSPLWGHIYHERVAFPQQQRWRG